MNMRRCGHYSLFLAACTLSLAGLCPSAFAEQRRVALVIGNNLGAGGDSRLKYAEADAHRVYSVLRALGGFDGSSALLLGRSAAEVRAAFQRLRGQLGTVPGENFVFIYYSGHADGQQLRIRGETIKFAEVKHFIENLSAALRVLVVDACQSGALTRVKGSQDAGWLGFEAISRPAQGLAILASSRDSEFSQESDELQGSFFSHHFNTGLLGTADYNHDGSVSLSEAFEYASGHTLVQTLTSQAGPQHPTFRYELSGQGEVSLTRPGRTGAGYGQLVFDLPGWYFLRHRSDRTLMAELKSNGTEVLAIEHGSYELTSRKGDHLLVGDLEAKEGTRSRVSELSMRRLDFGAAIRRKGAQQTVSYGWSFGPTIRSSLAELGPSAGVGATARADFNSASLELRLGVNQTMEETFQRSRTTEVGIAAACLKAWDLSSIVIAGGVELGWVGFHQATQWTGSHLASGPTMGPTMFTELAVMRNSLLRLDLGAPIYRIRVHSAEAHQFSWFTALRTGLAFGGYFE